MATIARIPFTESQWEELENQALVFKYIAAGVPVPSHLLFLIRRPFLSMRPSTFFSPHFGWNVGRKVDAEPGRCRRTDGKKWRCSKEASPDSKYCEKHMHRGKNRSSRKPPPPPPPPPPQFSVSSRRRSGYMDDFFSIKTQHDDDQREKQPDRHCFVLGTDLMLKQRDYDEEEQRSKRVYRFLDECPSSSSSSVCTSLFI